MKKGFPGKRYKRHREGFHIFEALRERSWKGEEEKMITPGAPQKEDLPGKEGFIDDRLECARLFPHHDGRKTAVQRE